MTDGIVILVFGFEFECVFEVLWFLIRDPAHQDFNMVRQMDDIWNYITLFPSQIFVHYLPIGDKHPNININPVAWDVPEVAPGITMGTKRVSSSLALHALQGAGTEAVCSWSASVIGEWQQPNNLPAE